MRASRVTPPHSFFIIVTKLLPLVGSLTHHHWFRVPSLDWLSTSLTGQHLPLCYNGQPVVASMPLCEVVMDRSVITFNILMLFQRAHFFQELNLLVHEYSSLCWQFFVEARRFSLNVSLHERVIFVKEPVQPPFLNLIRDYPEPFSILFIGALILCERVVDQVKIGLADDISGQSSPFSYILSSSVSRHN